MQYSLLKEMYEMEGDYWWHKGKRLYVLSLIRKFVKSKNPKILDVGCGTGYLLKELGDLGEAWGVDKSPASLSFCRKRGLKKLRRLDIEKKSFPGIKFDVVTALDVVEHIKDDLTAMKNVAKSLKPGGVFIFAAPAYPRLWSYWDEAAGHYRRYDGSGLTKLFRKSGFKIEYIRFTNTLVFIPAVLVRFLKQKAKIQESASDFVKVPDFINQILYFALKLEMFISFTVPLPFGLSYIVVARKV